MELIRGLVKWLTKRLATAFAGTLATAMAFAIGCLLPALVLPSSAAAAAAAAASPAEPLPRLEIDPDQITVSGLSSGGFMAAQLGYAHSALFRGVGVFAAGPYACAHRSSYPRCMENAEIGRLALTAIQADIDGWSGRQIDDRAHVAAQRVFLFVGDRDETVGTRPVEALRTQYASNGVAGEALAMVRRPGVAHVFPTDFDAAGNARCDRSESPFIANCGYDGAGAVLAHLYGPLKPRNDAPPDSGFRRFDQRAFGPANGLAESGWVYVPADCASGATCRLHVALHGCRQNESRIGERFVRNTGYARWADTNRIVLLFPQTRGDYIPRRTAASGWQPNPYGCFDWIGWQGANYATRDGAQVAAIRAMVEHLAPGTAADDGAATCTTASNVAHVSAGRAYAKAGLAWARGSDQNLGPWNALVTTSLRRTGPGHYVSASCP